MLSITCKLTMMSITRDLTTMSITNELNKSPPPANIYVTH